MAQCRLASAGDSIQFWDLREYSLVKQFNPHSGNVSSISWSQNNDFLASASSIGDKIAITYPNNPAYSFDIGTEEELTCIALNSASKYILGGGADGLVHIWDLRSRKLRKTYKDHKSKVTSVDFNWNDTMMASGSESGKIILFSVNNGIGYSPLVVPKAQAVRQVQYSHRKKSLLGSVSDDGAVNLWDTSAKKLIHSFTGSHKAPAMGLAFSTTNDMLVISVGLDKRIICYDVVQKCPLRVMTSDSPLTSTDMMADGSTLAVGTTRGKIAIYDLRLGVTPIKVLTAHKSSVQCLRFQNVQSVVGGIPRLTNSSQIHHDPSLLNNTNAVNNNIVQRDVTNGTAARPSADHDNQPQGSRNIPSEGYAYSPLKGNANLSRSSRDSSAVNSTQPSPMMPSRSSDVGFSEEEAMLYGMVDVRNSYGDTEVKSRVVPATRPQPVVVSSSISDDVDQTTGDHPDSGNSRFEQPASGSKGTRSAATYTSGNTNLSRGSRDSSAVNSTQPSPMMPSRPSDVGFSEEEAMLYGMDDVRNSFGDMEVKSRVAPTTRPQPVVSSSSISDDVDQTTGEHPDNANSQLGQPVSGSKSSRSAATYSTAPTNHTSASYSGVNKVTPMNSANNSANITIGRSRHTTSDSKQIPKSAECSKSSSRLTTYNETATVTPPEAGPSSEAVGGAASSTVQPFHTQFIRNIVMDVMEEFRDQIRQDIFNLYGDLLKQFFIQQVEIERLVKQHSVNGELLAEIQRLQEEIKQLKKNF